MTKAKTLEQLIASGIKIKYSDRAIENNCYTVDQVETFIKRAFKRKAEAIASKDGQVFGRSFKEGNKWNWFVDIKALRAAGH